MNWLIPALIATSCMTILIALIYFFLYYQEKKKFLGLWGISWAIYSSRFILHACIATKILPQWFVVFQQFASLLSVYIFINGTYIFLNRSFSRFWFYGTGFCIFWTIVTTFYSLSFLISHLPVAFFIGFAFCWTGYSLLKNQDIEGMGKKIAGWSLVFWGLHKADYPFLRPVLWFAPWGYLLASILFLTSAIGMLLVYYEKVRANLKKEVNERQKISDTLRERSALLNSIIEGTSDAIFIKDLNGRYILANQATLNALGKSIEEVIGKDDTHLFPSDSAQVISEADSNVFKYKKPQIAEEKLKTSYGDSFWLSNKSPYYDKDGNIIGIMGISRNITEQKKAEEERRILEERLKHSQKLETIGTLAGGIAHDFNNILSPIVGYTEMLLEDIPGNSPLRDRLDEIYTGSLRARDLVKQILTFSRQDSADSKFLKIQPIIKEALRLIRSTIPTTITIKNNISNDCGIIKADSIQIHQILMNLAINAFHAMEDSGGELAVSLKEIPLSEQDVIGLGIEPGLYACLTVADTGVGMDKAIMDKVFDPFFTTKGPGKGTGMGLSVVHGIVKNTGGNITVYSEPGKGTEFHIYLPVVKSTAEKHKHQIKESIQGGTERILLVDDEAAILKMEKQILERLGYQVVSCDSSLDALETFRIAPDKFDLIITDMAMPNMSGDKLAEKIIKIRPDIPILLCTGFSEKISDEKKAGLFGIKGYLMKPIVRADLSRKIREAFDSGN